MNTWCKLKNYDFSKVRILTALIYLNIAPLHHKPYNNLLFALGKQMLYREIKLMELINRSKCSLTGARDLESLYIFENYPLFMGCTNQDENEDIKIDMEWVISKSSGIIQLGKLIPLNILYSENHNNVIGNIWKSHHQEFAEFINKYKPSKGVLEIGGAHGFLSMIYQENKILIGQ